MKIVIAMAGLGKRSQSSVPKPLVQIAGRPMILWALDSLIQLSFSELIFVIRAEHEQKYQLSRVLTDMQHELLRDPSRIRIVLQTSAPTGQLTSVLQATSYLQTHEDVIVASADTFVVSDIAADINQCDSECRGIISVAEKQGIQWSFAKIEPNTKRVIEVAEKKRISQYASTGLYYFSSGNEFVRKSNELVQQGAQEQAEYYVIPVYQQYIDSGFRIDISSPAQEMWDLGSPEARASFLNRLDGRSELPQ